MRIPIRRWRRTLIPGCLIALVFAGLVLRALHLDDVAVRTPDERTYVGFASRVATTGPGVIATQFKEFAEIPATRDYPPPVRIAHTFLVASMMALADSTGFGPAVALSVLCSVFSLALVAWLGLRVFTPLTAVAAVIFLSTSLVELGLARRAWQDAVAGFFGLLVLWFAMEILRSPQRRWPYLALHLAGVSLVLMKQTGLIIYGLAVLVVMVWLFLKEHSLRKPLRVALSAAGSLAAGGLILVYFGGGWESTIQVTRLSLVFAPNAASYAASCCEGPWWQVLWAMILLNPLQVFFACLTAGSLIRLRSYAGRERSRYLLLALGVTIALVTFISITPLLQNLRYLSPVSGALALLAGRGVSLAAAKAGSARGAFRAVLIAGLLFAGAMDFERFVKLSVTAATPDLGAVQVRKVLTE